MAKKKQVRRKKGFEDRKVMLHTITRHILDDGETVEYHDHVEGPMPYSQLPKEALPVTGTKDDYCLVDMDPVLPAYCGEVERDTNGNPKKAHNFFDAQGYYEYAIDNRIRDAEQEVAAPMKVMRKQDWMKIITIAACAVVVGLVVWRFVA